MKSIKIIFCGLIFFSLIISSCQNKSDVETGLKIGIAEVNYTPPVGLDLVGNYRGDDYASRGVHDSLYSRALVAQGINGVKAAVITVDICCFGRESVEFMREYIASNSDIPQENIMILATHTHSGPPSELNAPKAKSYLKRAADAAINANNDLMPANLAIGRSNEDRISFNRRLKFKDGTTHMSWENPDPEDVEKFLGPKDPEVITISVEQNGQETGSIVNFGCHATTLTGDNWLYSADFPGYMVESIRKIKGEDYIPMFFNGPCGNVTQIDYKVGFISTYQESQRIGYLLGVSAIEAMANETDMNDANVMVSREYVPLQYIKISDERYQWAKKVMKKVEEEGMPPLQKDGIPDAVYAQQWINIYENQSHVDSLEVMVMRIGNLALVGYPGEIFAEFGMEIKEKSPSQNTIVMGLANDDRNYFPTKISFTQGPKGFTPMITGYETTPGTTMYEIGAGEKLTASALKQLDKLFE